MTLSATSRPAAGIDACCLIDLLASGHAEAILRACQLEWMLPRAVRGEVQFVRQADPLDATKIIRARVDLSPFISAGLLALCQPDVPPETALFVRYASVFRSDGEAMCVALAEARGWMVATDDRKAICVAQQTGLVVISAPAILKTWADETGATQTTIVAALESIERLAQFRPNSAMPEYLWWQTQLGRP